MNSTIRFKMRTVYLLAIVITIILGLASRNFSHQLPIFISDNAGDALWAMMVYWGFRFLFVEKHFRTAIWASLLFSFSIEFSQLYQVDWINQIRATRIGALILGKGFLAVDLIRYMIGILIGNFLDVGLKKMILREK